MKEVIQLLGTIVTGCICFAVVFFASRIDERMMYETWQRVDNSCEVITITSRLVIQDNQCTGDAIADFSITYVNDQFVYASRNGKSIALFMQSPDTVINTRSNPPVKYIKK